MTPASREASARRSSHSNRLVFAGALLGLTVFVLARLGVTLLPFDEHHALTQLLGLGIMLGALTQWR